MPLKRLLALRQALLTADGLNEQANASIVERELALVREIIAVRPRTVGEWLAKAGLLAELVAAGDFEPEWRDLARALVSEREANYRKAEPHRSGVRQEHFINEVPEPHSGAAARCAVEPKGFGLAFRS